MGPPLFAAMALILSGCGASSEGSPDVVSENGTIALVRVGDKGGMDAGFEGTVAIGPGDCLSLKSGDASPIALLWPRGTSLAAGGVKIPDLDERVSVGAKVSGAGGEILQPKTHGYPNIPDACLSGSDVAMEVASLKVESAP